MATRPMSFFVLTAALAAGSLPGARAEPLPAPTGTLRDYVGRAILQIDLPAQSTDKKDGAGKTVVEPALNLVVPMNQAFVGPDRFLVENLLGGRQVTLVLANTERTYVPGTGFLVECTYKNVDPKGPSPIPAMQLSMATYAELLKGLKDGKILPPEDLDALQKARAARIKELADLRESLAETDTPEALAQRNAAASEQARLHDDLEQIEVRRAHPCHIIQFDNKDLLDTLLARGLTGKLSRSRLEKGTTTFWVTKGEGLPIKMETTVENGRVALFFCFTQLKLNSGIRSSDLALNAPVGTRLLATVVNVREQNWEEAMQRDLSTQMYRLENDRVRRQQAQQRRK